MAPTPQTFWAFLLCLCASSVAAQETGGEPATHSAGDPNPAGQWLVVAQEGCLSHPELLRSVLTWLPSVPAGRRVLVQREQSEVLFVVYADGALLGERRFTTLPTECAERRAALSLAIAIALDRDVLARVGISGAMDEGSESNETSDASAVVEVTPSEDSLGGSAPAHAEVPVSDPTPPDSVSLSIDVRAMGGVGVLPAFTGALELGASLGRDRWSLRLSLWGTARELSLGVGRVTVQAYGGFVEACMHRRSGRLGLVACIGMGGGTWMGEGAGFAVSSSAQTGFMDGLAEVGLRFPVDGRVGLSTGIRARAPFIRPSFSSRSENGERLAQVQSAVVGAEAWLGIELRFF